MKPLFSKQEGWKKKSKIKFLCPWLDVWLDIWLSEDKTNHVPRSSETCSVSRSPYAGFMDSWGHAWRRKGDVLLAIPWKWDKGCDLEKVASPGQIQGTDYDKKIPAEAGGRGPVGIHCLTASVMVVISCLKTFTERQVYCSVPPCDATETSFLFPLYSPCTSSAVCLLLSAHCANTRGVSRNTVLGQGPHVPAGHKEDSLRGIAAHERKGRKAHQF